MSGKGRRDLSCKDAGQILGVSESTVKRLSDSGQFTVIRTPGGHRRIVRQSVYDWLVRQSGKTDITPDESCPARETVTPVELLEYFLQDDVDQTFSLLEAYRLAHGVAELFDAILGPMMEEVGIRWEQQRLKIYQERQITGRLREYLNLLSQRIPRNLESSGRAVGSAPENDPSEIASQCIELCLRDCGWNAVSYGASFPAVELAMAANSSQASLVWVSYTHQLPESQTQTANRELRSLLPSQTRLLIGGRALTTQIRRQLDFDFAGDSMNHLCRYVGRLDQPVSPSA